MEPPLTLRARTSPIRRVSSKPFCSLPNSRHDAGPCGDDQRHGGNRHRDNRKAFHDYHILETFEAGIALLGTEVKGIREGKANLRDSYARVEGAEVWLYNVHINPYSHRGYVDHDPKRRRKLLLHKQEIQKLIGKTVEKGLTLVPTRLYFKNGKIKVALALAKGKQARDKRETIKRREIDRETRAAVKEGRR
jgi:SsrA-binding protein